MWWHRFVNRTDAYALQKVQHGNVQYSVQYKPLTEGLFNAHINGDITLGLPGIDEHGRSRWCCFDSDKPGDELDRIEAMLKKHHWQCIREGQRPGRAGHLWVFFDQPVPADLLRAFSKHMMKAANVPPGSLEFFPKQDKPTFDADRNRYKAGSIVRLPLGIHRKPEANGDRGWFSGIEKCLVLQTLWIDWQPVNSASSLLAMAPQIMRRNLILQEPYQSPQFILPMLSPHEVMRVHDALECIPADDYAIWIRVGMALKDAGIDCIVWDKWSQKSAKYQHGACQSKWDTFSSEGRAAVRIGTIFELAKHHGF